MQNLLNYEMDEAAKKYRDDMVKYLLIQPEILNFMKTYSCPESVVFENVSKFKRWLETQRSLKNISESMIENGEHQGSYIDLHYDDALDVLKEIVRETPALKKIKEKTRYLKNYRVMPLPNNLQSAHFKSIDLNLENQNYEVIYALLVKFTKDATLGYYINGDLGVGKTYLAACVTNYFASAGESVALIHVPSFFAMLKASFGSEELKDPIRALKNVKVLVLDDLGAEPVSQWSRDEVLLSIINDRLENKRKTLITSNYTLDHLIDKYSLDSRGVLDVFGARRLIERIQMLTKPLELRGNNRRIVSKP